MTVDGGNRASEDHSEICSVFDRNALTVCSLECAGGHDRDLIVLDRDRRRGCSRPAARISNRHLHRHGAGLIDRRDVGVILTDTLIQSLDEITHDRRAIGSGRRRFDVENAQTLDKHIPPEPRGISFRIADSDKLRAVRNRERLRDLRVRGRMIRVTADIFLVLIKPRRIIPYFVAVRIEQLEVYRLSGDDGNEVRARIRRRRLEVSGAVDPSRRRLCRVDELEIPGVRACDPRHRRDHARGNVHSHGDVRRSEK